MNNFLIVYDDREYVSGNIENFVGHKSYGDIQFKKFKVSEIFKNLIDKNLLTNFLILKTSLDIQKLRKFLQVINEDIGIFIIASQTSLENLNVLMMLLNKAQYSEDTFVNKSHNPTILFFKSAKYLLDYWTFFENDPIHKWNKHWYDEYKINLNGILNLSLTNDFLKLITNHPKK